MDINQTSLLNGTGDAPSAGGVGDVNLLSGTTGGIAGVSPLSSVAMTMPDFPPAPTGPLPVSDVGVSPGARIGSTMTPQGIISSVPGSTWSAAAPVVTANTIPFSAIPTAAPVVGVGGATSSAPPSSLLPNEFTRTLEAFVGEKGALDRLEYLSNRFFRNLEHVFEADGEIGSKTVQDDLHELQGILTDMASWARSSGVGGLTLIESGTKSSKKPATAPDSGMNVDKSGEAEGDGKDKEKESTETDVDDEDRLSLLSVSSETSEDYQHQHQHSRFGLKKKPQPHQHQREGASSTPQPEKRVRGDDDALMKEVQEEFKKALMIRNGAQVVVDSLKQQQR